MDFGFEIEAIISQAQNENDLVQRLDIYLDVITKILNNEIIDLHILSAIEQITFDLSEIAKKHRVLNQGEIVNGHKQVQKIIKETKNENTNDTLPLLAEQEHFFKFLSSYKYGVIFMQNDLHDIKTHTKRFKLQPIWILLIILSLFGLYAAITRKY